MQPSILVMEDNPVLGERMKQALSDAGYHCRLTPGVEKALRAIDVLEPHLVIADYTVIDGTALDLLNRLAERASDHIPFVLCTAVAASARAATAAFRQVKCVIEKPIPEDDVIALAACFARTTAPSPRHPRLVGPVERRLLLGALAGTWRRMHAAEPAQMPL